MPCQIAKGHLLFVGTTVLTICGLLMVYSASMAAMARDGDPLRFFLRQSAYAGIGFGLMVATMFVDYRLWLKNKTIYFLLACSVLGLILVFMQAPIKGAHRAIRFGSIGSFQPSEVAKLVLIFYVTAIIQRFRAEAKPPLSQLLSHAAVIAFSVGLICFEPDLGQAICILAIMLVLLFVAGLEWKYLGSAACFSVPAFYLFVWKVEFRRKRFLDWLVALHNPLKAGYHIRNSIIGIGHGGLLGLGFGDGQQKLSYLPEAPTDFIYAVIGEEFGLLGSLLIAAVFLGYLYLGVKTSVRAQEPGGFYLGLAITLMVVLPAFINMSTALALVPTKGLTLPFISRGGSSLLVNLVATGVLINVSCQQKTD